MEERKLALNRFDQVRKPVKRIKLTRSYICQPIVPNDSKRVWWQTEFAFECCAERQQLPTSAFLLFPPFSGAQPAGPRNNNRKTGARWEDCSHCNVYHRYNRAPIPSDTFSRPALDFWDFSRPKDRKWLRSGCESVCKVITNGKTAADGVKVCRMIDNVHFTKFRDQFIFHLSTTILHKDIAAGLLCGQPVEN